MGDEGRATDAGPTPVDLPILAHRAAVVSHVAAHRVTVVQGGSGCGKSVLIPQFLLHSGPAARVVVASPSSLAADSVAQGIRAIPIAGERAPSVVRLADTDDSLPTDDITVCTHASLLRFLAAHPAALSGITHVVVDEVHKRSVDADLLLLLLKLLLPLSVSFRLLLVSATPPTQLLRRHFAACGPLPPPLSVGTSPHEVTEVFLDDIPMLYPGLAAEAARVLVDRNGCQPTLPPSVRRLLVGCVRLLVRPGATLVVFLPGPLEASYLTGSLQNLTTPDAPIELLRLADDAAAMSRARKPPNPLRCRVIVADDTHTAALAIPHVTAVIDSGLQRSPTRDSRSGLLSSRMRWVSAATATQRAGRTGRGGPGTLLRLYPQELSSRVRPHDRAPMRDAPLAQVVLKTQMLLGAFGAVSDLLSQSPNPPAPGRVAVALEGLETEGAMVTVEDGTVSLTALGRLAVFVPLDPRLLRMLLVGASLGTPLPMVVIAVALAQPDLLPLPDPRDGPTQFATAVAASSNARLRSDEGRLSDPLSLLAFYVLWLQRKSCAFDPARARALDVALLDTIPKVLEARQILGLSAASCEDLDTLRAAIQAPWSRARQTALERLTRDPLPLLQFGLGLAGGPDICLGRPTGADDSVAKAAAAHGCDPRRTVRLSGLTAPRDSLAEGSRFHLPRCGAARIVSLAVPLAGSGDSSDVLLEFEGLADAGLPPSTLLSLIHAESGGRIPMAPPRDPTVPQSPVDDANWRHVDRIEVPNAIGWVAPARGGRPLTPSPRSVIHALSPTTPPVDVTPLIASAAFMHHDDEVDTVSSTGLTLLPPSVASLVLLLSAPRVTRLRACVAAGRHTVAAVDLPYGGTSLRLSFEDHPLEPPQWEAINTARATLGRLAGGTEAVPEGSLRPLVEELLRHSGVRLDGGWLGAPPANPVPSSASSSGPEDPDRWRGWRWHRMQRPLPTAEGAPGRLPPLTVGPALPEKPPPDRVREYQRRRYESAMRAEYQRIRAAVARAMADHPLGLSPERLRPYEELGTRRAKAVRLRLGYPTLRDLLASMPDLVRIVDDADEEARWRLMPALPPAPGGGGIAHSPTLPASPPLLLPRELRPYASPLLLPTCRPSILRMLLEPVVVPECRISQRTPEGPTDQQRAAMASAEYWLLRDCVASIMRGYPNGAPMQTLMKADSLAGISARRQRRRLGFARLWDFLSSMPDVATVFDHPRLGQVVFPAGVDVSAADVLIARWNEPTVPASSPLGSAYASFLPRNPPILTPPTPAEFFAVHAVPVDRSAWTPEDWHSYNDLRRYVKLHLRQSPNGISAVRFTRMPRLGGKLVARRAWRRLGFESAWGILLSMPDLVDLRADHPDVGLWTVHPAADPLPPAALPIPDSAFQRRPPRLGPPVSFPEEYQQLADFPVPALAVVPPNFTRVREGKLHRAFARLRPEFAVFRALVLEALRRLPAGTPLPVFANAAGLAWERVRLRREALFNKATLMDLLGGMPDIVRLERDRYDPLILRVFPAAYVGPPAPFPDFTAPAAPTNPVAGVTGPRPPRAGESYDDEAYEAWADHIAKIRVKAYTMKEGPPDPRLAELEATVPALSAPLPQLSFFWTPRKPAEYRYLRRLIHRYVQRTPEGKAAFQFFSLPGLVSKKPRTRWQQMGYRTFWQVLETVPDIVTIVPVANKPRAEWLLRPTHPIPGIELWPKLERPPWEWITRPKVIPFGPLPDPPVTTWDVPPHLDPLTRPAETEAPLRPPPPDDDSGVAPKSIAWQKGVQLQQLPKLEGDGEELTATEGLNDAVTSPPVPSDSSSNHVTSPPVPPVLEAPLEEFRDVVRRSIAEYPDGIALRVFCLNAGLATPRWVRLRKALGYQSMTGLLRTLPDVVEVAKDPGDPDALFAFPAPGVHPPPVRRKLFPLARVLRQLERNPFYARFTEKVKQRLAHVYPDGIPERAAKPLTRPLAPGEVLTPLDGYTEVAALYRLYVTYSGERNKFPKVKRKPVEDMESLLAFIKKEILKYPNGVDVGRLCMEGRLTTTEVRAVYQSLGFSTMAEFLASRTELVEVQEGPRPRQHTVYPARRSVPGGPDPFERYLAWRAWVAESLDPSVIDDHWVVLGPGTGGPPSLEQVTDFLAFKAMISDFIRGFPRGLYFTRFCVLSGLTDPRLVDRRNALGFANWRHLTDRIPDVIDAVDLGAKNGGWFVAPTPPASPVDHRPAHEPAVTSYAWFLARMTIRLSQPPDEALRPHLSAEERSDAGALAALGAIRDLVQEGLRAHPKGQDPGSLVKVSGVGDQRIGLWRDMLGHRDWLDFFRANDDLTVVVPDPEDPAARLLVLPASVSPSLTLPEPGDSLSLPSPAPVRLQEEAAALRRMLEAGLRHFPDGADLGHFCIAAGLSDPRLVPKWRALGFPTLTDWLRSLPDVVAIVPKADDPITFDVFPADTIGQTAKATFRRTVAELLAPPPDSAPEPPHQSAAVVAAEYQALRLVIQRIIARHPNGIDFPTFVLACGLESDELSAARRRVGYSLPVNLLRSVPDLVELRRDAERNGWTVHPAAPLQPPPNAFDELFAAEAGTTAAAPSAASPIALGCHCACHSRPHTHPRPHRTGRSDRRLAQSAGCAIM